MKNTQKGNYYITTPIYYPSASLHIGHTYCTVMADAMARFKRLSGYNVRFLTGTDEHGQKIQDKAIEKGVTPKEYVDEIVAGIKKLWKIIEISYDDFIRTTEERHMTRVQRLFLKMYEKGDIYKGEYEGHYCKPCEAFWTPTQLNDGCCPDCGRPVQTAKEEAYFFRMSKYQDRLLELYDSNPEFLQPESRRNEMKAFVSQGLEDLCISRSTFDWGIPVPIDEKHVIYVWLDALANYITALGYPDETPLYSEFWPANVHLVGKEIVRFHSVIWPAMLMSLDVPLPKQVLGHGWLLLDGKKMGKSTGNVVDPVKLIELYGVDALKYFLLREFTFGSDGTYTTEALIRRLNSDLANDLGNLVSRTASMVEKYRDSKLPHMPQNDKLSEVVVNATADLKETALEAGKKLEAHMNEFSFNMALEEAWIVIRRANKYIDETMPWALAKDEKDADNLDAVLKTLTEVIRIVAILIYPFMHTTSEKIFESIGLAGNSVEWEEAFEFDKLGGVIIKKGEALFPRIDVEKELERLQKEQEEAQKTNEVKKEEAEVKPEIGIEDFAKIDLRVGEIVEAKKHPKADKLLIFKVKVGGEIRQIVSGVAESIDPDCAVGQKVIVVANLKKIVLRGEESQGMLLFADSNGKDIFATADAEAGDAVK
ncbi:MAG: methionine--tRNA ligase [Clostridiales bacterium]|nr:methionine--tRNA ligase [Clostridiales bacterium]